MKLHFPHISRIFAARIFSLFGTTTIWSILAILFAVNIFSSLNSAPLYWQQVTLALRWPFSSQIHDNLAKTYWSHGMFQAAQRELSYITSIHNRQPSTPVLGATTNEISSWELLEARKKKSYDRWIQIINQKPDYRDGLLILASLAYDQSRVAQAHAYAQQAFELDPNSGLANKLLILTSQKK